jgi:hypothetical protein
MADSHLASCYTSRSIRFLRDNNSSKPRKVCPPRRGASLITQVHLNRLDLPPVPASAAGRAYERYRGALTPQQRRPRQNLSRRDQRQLRALGCLKHDELCSTVARACSVSSSTSRSIRFIYIFIMNVGWCWTSDHILLMSTSGSKPNSDSVCNRLILNG